jgi:hypothetical protein
MTRASRAGLPRPATRWARVIAASRQRTVDRFSPRHSPPSRRPRVLYLTSLALLANWRQSLEYARVVLAACAAAA